MKRTETNSADSHNRCETCGKLPLPHTLGCAKLPAERIRILIYQAMQLDRCKCALFEILADVEQSANDPAMIIRDNIDRLIACGTRLTGIHTQIGTKGLKVDRVPDCLVLVEQWNRLVAEVREERETGVLKTDNQSNVDEGAKCFVAKQIKQSADFSPLPAEYGGVRGDFESKVATEVAVVECVPELAGKLESTRDIGDGDRQPAENTQSRPQPAEGFPVISDTPSNSILIDKSINRCPKCGFSFKWDGVCCAHCHLNETLPQKPLPKPVSQPQSKYAWMKIGLIICCAMILYPPWTERPELVYLGDYAINRFEERSAYKLHPKAPIRNELPIRYNPLWDPPTKRYPQFTSMEISKDRLLYQSVAVLMMCWILLARTRESRIGRSDSR